MPPATIDLEFAKWLLIGMGTAVVGEGVLIVFLVKKIIELGEKVAVACNKSSEVAEESNEILRSIREEK